MIINIGSIAIPATKEYIGSNTQWTAKFGKNSFGATSATALEYALKCEVERITELYGQIADFEDHLIVIDKAADGFITVRSLYDTDVTGCGYSLKIALKMFLVDLEFGGSDKLPEVKFNSQGRSTVQVYGYGMYHEQFYVYDKEHDVLGKGDTLYAAFNSMHDTLKLVDTGVVAASPAPITDTQRWGRVSRNVRNRLEATGRVVRISPKHIWYE